MQMIKRYGSYLVILFAFAVIGMTFSFDAQEGGINQLNAFIAPIIGPFSRCLAPNADKLNNWEAKTYLFVVSVTLVTMALVKLSSKPEKKVLRILTKLTAHLAVVFWCLCGMYKVILELS